MSSTASAVAAGGRGRTKQGASKPSVHEAFDDGWESLGLLEAFKTEVFEDTAKSIIARNDSPDISFDRSINPYRGCEHGCIYCYARPSHCYLGHSAGLDFETKLYAKSNAATLLAKELAKPGYKPRDDRAWGQYRSLSADRTRAAHHAIDPRSAGANEPSGRHHHQIGAGRARHRHSAADGRERHCQGRGVDHQSRSQSCPRHGAACRDAAQTSRHGAAAEPKREFR